MYLKLKKLMFFYNKKRFFVVFFQVFFFLRGITILKITAQSKDLLMSFQIIEADRSPLNELAFGSMCRV